MGSSLGRGERVLHLPGFYHARCRSRKEAQLETGRPATRAANGMVACPHVAASAAGVEMLKAGGSAVDAAIAASAVLSVVYPHMTSIGGDQFWLIWDADRRAVRFLNAGGRAAASGTLEWFASRGLDDIPMRGILPATLTTPGAVDGWCEAHAALGRLSLARDLAEQRARWGEPVSATYRGVTIYETPPPTQGLSVLQMLNLIEPVDLSRLDRLGPDAVHLLVQAKQIAFHDRDRHIADPDFFKVPVERLLSKAYANERRLLLDPHRALPWDRVPSYGSLEGDTVAVCAVDAHGNAATLIHSVYGIYGAGGVALARRPLRPRRSARSPEHGGALSRGHPRRAGAPRPYRAPVARVGRAGGPRPRHHHRSGHRRPDRRLRPAERRRRHRLLNFEPPLPRDARFERRGEG